MCACPGSLLVLLVTFLWSQPLDSDVFDAVPAPRSACFPLRTNEKGSVCVTRLEVNCLHVITPKPQRNALKLWVGHISISIGVGAEAMLDSMLFGTSALATLSSTVLEIFRETVRMPRIRRTFTL